MGYGSGTQLWRPLKTFETHSPKWAMHPRETQVLLPHLGSLESLPFFLLSRTFETKRNNTSHSGQLAWAPSGCLLMQYAAGSHQTRILPALGTLHTPRFRL